MSVESESQTARARLIAQFFHLEKLPMLARAGLRAADLLEISARIADASPEALREQRELLEREAATCADELLADAEFAAGVRRLPFRHGDVIVAVGDSITDDATSWAHILDRVLATAVPGVVVRNHGITGNTTGEVLHRLDLIARERPNWVIQMIGTNDARRHGALRTMTTSPQETARNLGVLARFVRVELAARHVVMTPPPTIDEWVTQWAPFDVEAITWYAEDVQVIADLVLAESAEAIDLHAAFRRAAETTLLLPDGVHPNAVGQRLIVRTLVDSLNSIHP
ncbi:SGNH/GDSL hydrolase family protein [Pseudolysinimonas sp.]|jgi:lysophospholipase L1-like esterase|uniref:SGNH/GDSL hydrolase family protein n=1 Tax=Pseudolysinimonas sp. TaxID=2680009 RepID=UPI0037842F49